jgi:hypothetical protein
MVGVAQLAERLVVFQEVAGSTPVAHPHEGQEFPPLRKGRTGYPVRPLLVSRECTWHCSRLLAGRFPDLIPHCIKGTT